MFRDRTAAGTALADLLADSTVTADVVVGVAHGGMPVARAVAASLSVPLDTVAARRIGAPGNPELPVAVVAGDGSVWHNVSLIGKLRITPTTLAVRTDEAQSEAAELAAHYREDGETVDLDSRSVVVVDDGVTPATTTLTCLRAVRNADAARVTLAVPACPRRSLPRFRAVADEVVSVATPPADGETDRLYEIDNDERTPTPQDG